MMNKNTPWFKIINNKISILPESASKCGITTDNCMLCTYILISKVYQTKACGSRYCQNCIEDLNDKYYCTVCAADDPSNIVHSKNDIYEDKALMKDMEKMKIKCPDCELPIRLLDLENHIAECSKGWIYCEDCDQMVKKVPKHQCKGLSNHQSKYKICESCGKVCENLDKHKTDCSINWKRPSCPFGCSVNTKMEHHRKDQALFHLDKAWAILHEHHLTAFKKDDNSSEYKYFLKDAVENVRKSIDFDKESIARLSKELKNSNDTMMKDAEIYESFKASIKSQMEDTLSTSFDGTIVWRIDGFNEIRSKAKNESQKSIFSPPFYTSRFGYKMCLRLYPNGDTTAWNTAMSLFLVIMKGNYDSLLQWPFKQKVTFVLLDQDFKCNMIDAFVPSENSTSFLRPRTDMNVPSGSSFFIKFDDMKLRTYVKDNTVFIRCIIDCSDLH